MVVCVIGCTGYLGSKISSRLHSQGHKVVGVCRKFPKDNKRFKNIFYKIIEGDITNTKFQSKVCLPVNDRLCSFSQMKLQVHECCVFSKPKSRRC